MHQFEFLHVYPRRKVSLIISFSKWRNRFGKDEAFAEVHVTLSGRTRALTSAALIYQLLCVFSINQVKWWQFASNILPMLSSIHIYTHRPLPCLLGTVCVSEHVQNINFSKENKKRSKNKFPLISWIQIFFPTVLLGLLICWLPLPLLQILSIYCLIILGWS